MLTNERFLILGGGGMIGKQIALEILRELSPELIVISSLRQEEVEKAASEINEEFHKPPLITEWGDVFLRTEYSQKDRSKLLHESRFRDALYDDLFKEIGHAYSQSELVRLILRHRPHVIIDSINTATGISYQDIDTASAAVRKCFSKLSVGLKSGEASVTPEDSPADHPEHDMESATPSESVDELLEETGSTLEKVLISQSLPQLIRHVRLINDAMIEAKTRLYIKVGTTGTGGMGLNVPYTHSEDKPSATLMGKTAIAFAHTGLMFLMARTLGGPAVKEVKPGAMVGYSSITTKPIKAKGPFRTIGEPGELVRLYNSRKVELKIGGELPLRPPKEGDNGYETAGELRLIVADLGENGLFTKGEFETITHMRQMEFITPEEIARQVVLEIKGSNTGYDVIAAIDGAVMNPTYRAGYLRYAALEEFARLERLSSEHDKNGYSSIVLGDLGPPELGKLLWEAQLLKLICGTLGKVIAESPENLSKKIQALLEEKPELRQKIVSVGFPVLVEEDDSLFLIRGPYLRIPQDHIKDDAKPKSLDEINKWADKGWVDLRTVNMERWRQRFKQMRPKTKAEAGEHNPLISTRGSAAFTRESYLPEEIYIGEVVGWIFNNEDDFGYRIK
ncbi:MAG TPA: hypothetical protein VM911_12185 [Pyrinomonadaceae bacterium]|jgi:NAD(P)-dependent dehydrogenase (short-subunit alcohol dehydrogenase family)|nr:hypothetical protein [Pyrinomonadaceae bacterium]